MSRNTTKYLCSLAALQGLSPRSWGGTVLKMPRAVAYGALRDQGYRWDAKKQEWVRK